MKPIKERLQDFEFVDMMVEMEKAEKEKEAAESRILKILSVYKMTKTGYNGRKAKMLENDTLENLVTKYK